MRVGMLWFDDSKNRDLAAKVDQAARHYEAKYGTRPTLCYVHPSMLLDAPASPVEIEIKSSNTVLPNHLWIGRGDEVERRTAA